MDAAAFVFSSIETMRGKMGTVVLFGNSNIDVRVGQGYEMGRSSTLALRTELSNSEIQVFVGGSVVEVAEGVGLTVSRCQWTSFITPCGVLTPCHGELV